MTSTSLSPLFSPQVQEQLTEQVPSSLGGLARVVIPGKQRCRADERNQCQHVAGALRFAELEECAVLSVEPDLAVDRDPVRVDHVHFPRRGQPEQQVVERRIEDSEGIAPEGVEAAERLLAVVDPAAVTPSVPRGLVGQEEVRSRVEGACFTLRIGEDPEQRHWVAVRRLGMGAQAGPRAYERYGDVRVPLSSKNTGPLVVMHLAELAEVGLLTPADVAVPRRDRGTIRAEAVTEGYPIPASGCAVAQHPTEQILTNELVPIQRHIEAGDLIRPDQPHSKRLKAREAPSMHLSFLSNTLGRRASAPSRQVSVASVVRSCAFLWCGAPRSSPEVSSGTSPITPIHVSGPPAPHGRYPRSKRRVFRRPSSDRQENEQDLHDRAR